ncbi:piezo-type mechanosensitive ion channel component 2-like isoform X4 [Anneissia japonica]|uniref:piezo-type mechanosensitive ion channel component 2-like isoform X4 n=1 Tax=Anneissia japonica TaxID=1529436 RepID=UPI00142568DF|nr:piezo-type mechanosensitive ion channel component 2-like isoform X4 [Anneissia japonica]
MSYNKLEEENDKEMEKSDRSNPAYVPQSGIISTSDQDGGTSFQKQSNSTNCDTPHLYRPSTRPSTLHFTSTHSRTRTESETPSRPRSNGSVIENRERTASLNISDLPFKQLWKETKVLIKSRWRYYKGGTQSTFKTAKNWLYSKLFIMWLLFKILLPTFLLLSCLFRYNGLSFIYLLCLLCVPLLQSPTAQSMKGATGKYLKLLVAFSAAASIGQLIFQIVLLIDQPYGNFLDPCNSTERILRQLGFQRLDSNALSSIRLLAPDVVVLIVSSIVLAICHKLLAQENQRLQELSQTSQTDTTYERKSKKRSIVIAGLRGLLTMTLLAFAAVIEPSMISAVYFVSFLIVVTWWSLYKTTGKRFVYWQGCWMVFSGFHLILLYLYQFQFFQDNVDSGSLTARLVGLKAIIKTECTKEKVYDLLIHDDLLWPAFVNPAAILLLYWYCALEVRRFMQGPRNGYDQLIGKESVELVEVQKQTHKKHRRKSGERESTSSKKKLLVTEEMRKGSPDYQTMESSTPTDVEEGTSYQRQARTDSETSGAVEHPKASPLGTLVAYITKQSYIAALVLMMAWSITYHSWLSFVLLLWACACWIIPGSRKCALYSSPFIVIYAECLIIIQFVYGLNLNEEELPTVTEDGVDLTEIGLVRYEIPCTVLAVKLLYTCMFWMTLRQFCRENKLRELDHHQAADGIILQPFGMIFSAPSDEVKALNERAETGDHVDRVQSETMMVIGAAIMDLIAKYWILLCGGMFLIVSLQDTVDCFKIIYMGLFLFLMTIFVFSWRLFRVIVYFFWWIVVIYSMIVLVLIYTFQFEKFPEYWQNSTHLSKETLSDIGLEEFSTSKLFLNLLIPTSFIIVIVVQIHYFHSHFLKLSDIKKPSGSNYAVTSDDTAIEGGSGEDLDEVDASSQKSNAQKSLKLYIGQLFKTGLAYYHRITSVLWRIIEIHMMKVVFITIIVVACNEVTAVNCVFVCLMFFAIPVHSLQRLFCLIAIIWASLVMLAKMIYQLNFIDTDEFTENCTERNPDWYGEEMVNSTSWLGFEVPTDQSFPDYVHGYMFIIIVLIVNSIVILHQRQHYWEQGKPIPKDGIIFEGVNRANADEGLLNMLKFLANYGFYKYGLEISYIMVVITVCIRLDLFSVIYMTFLLIMIFLDRKVVMVIWPIFLIVLAILLPVSYCLCLGLPPSFCVNYIWTTNDLPSELITWLYLPVYDNPLNAKVIIADFFQLLFVSLQWQVFLKESKSGFGGGDNNVAATDVENIDTNPVPNFTFNKSYLDLCKSSVLGYNFWVCLAVLYITATSHTNILGVGYLIIAFSCLGFGRNLLLKPMSEAVKLWNLVILYNLCVVIMKVGLQILTCAYLNRVLEDGNCLCALIQLLGVVCLQKGYETPTDLCTCELPTDESGLSWDVVCFCFLIIQKRIFTSYYFQYIVIDLQEEKKLASKGAELINDILAAKVRNNKKVEAQILDKIKSKTEKIRTKQKKLLLQKEYQEPLDHGEAIRGNAGYYMFVDSDSEDDFSDFEEESVHEYGEPEEVIPRSQIKRRQSITDMDRKQSAWQLAFQAFMTSPKTALETDEALSPTSPEGQSLTVIGEERKDEADGVQPSTSGAAVADVTDDLKGEETDVDRGVPVTVDEALVEVVDDVLDKLMDDEDEEEFGCWDKFLNILRLAWRIFLRLIDSAIARLDKSSEEYRYVAKELKRMSAEGKRRRSVKRAKLKNATETDGDGVLEEEEEEEEEPAVRSEPREDVTVTTVDVASPGTKSFEPAPDGLLMYLGDFEDSVDTGSSDKFENSMPRPIRLLNSVVYWGIAHSELICYFVIILNHLVSASILSLPLPILVFLWAMLTVPRPTKRFWITVITYTEIVVILKYIFQFQFYPWYDDVTKEENPLWWPRLIGIEKEDQYAVFDLIVLLAVFLHRSILRRHGLWQESRVLPDFHDVELNESLEEQKEEEDVKDGGHLSVKEKGSDDVDDTGSVKSDESEEKKETSIFDPFRHFYQRLIDPTYSYVTDVYVTMFGCDFINFLITTFCSYAFGEEQAQTDVTEYILNNQIPMSFVLLLLIQFILILVDRAIYLKKNVTAKFIFLIVLVIAIHGWLFFLLPWMSNKQFVDNTPAQIFYFFKCLYFGLSAYQIRCGYPTRILGNFLTKSYNYVSLFLFYGWQLIPFLMEIRIVMDWMFTPTTLSLTHWVECEDIFADCFITKCWRKMEKKYPAARGVAKSSLVKYGAGGVMLSALVLIIWFPLLFISFVNTSSIPNPPSIATVQIQIAGYEPLFDMNSQDQAIHQMTSDEFSDLRDDPLYKTSLQAQSFFNQYQADDVYIITFLGESSSTWDISPPGREELAVFLNNTNVTVSVKFQYSFTRQTSSTLVTPTVGNSHTIELPASDPDHTRKRLINMLSFSGGPAPVLQDLFPPYMKVPATGPVEPVTVLLDADKDNLYDNYTSVSARLVNGSIPNLVGDREWWSVGEVDCAYKRCSKTSLRVITFNDRVASDVFAPVSSYGVIGLYVSLVLVIGRFVRMYFSGIRYQIMFNELPNVDHILRLCLDIFLVRECQEMALEEDLMAKLIFLYRSPETLIRFTKYKRD